MKYKKRILFPLIFFSFSALPGQQLDLNFSYMLYGREVPASSARALALGGSGIAGGEAVDASFLNPALLGNGKAGIGLNAGFFLDHVEEDRAYPYYDSFEGFNGYGSYSFNKNWYPNGYGLISYTVDLPAVNKLSLSSGFLPFIDFTYHYREEVGNPNRTPDYKKDKILGYNSIESTGRLNRIPLAIAVKPLDNLSVGLQVDVLSGSIDSLASVSPREEMFPPEEIEAIKSNEKTTKTLNNTPLVFSLGLHYRFGDRLSAGFLIRGPYEIQFLNRYENTQAPDKNRQEIRTLSYPMRLGLGLDYRFTNILSGRLSFDFVYDFWSQFKDDLRPGLEFNDTYSLRTGVEHLFFDEIPLRFGFRYNSMRESRNFSESLITFGTSFRFLGVTVDLSAGISSQVYYQYDLFDDSIYGLFSRGSELDKVTLSTIYGRLSIQYVFFSLGE
ncbi:MAG TPA: hypothetical protein ENK44_01225 [Caldithrix abyssi]|uniref:Long-chain fatty acid transport protein n=1 Tax=Caldithrix abyssi TaxID=187145 RepID=A0A7V4TYG4_CALAY|nr:hypothetical protein [Caldithrix abyssi]